MSQRIIVRRDELFTPDVDEALQKQHALQGQVLSDASEVSPLRRVLMSAMFYLPVAGRGSFLAVASKTRRPALLMKFRSLKSTRILLAP